MHHHHSHAHCHHPDHHHPHLSPEAEPNQKSRLLWTALLLIGGFSLTEFGMGLWSHSLALLADSGHLLSDCLALGLSLLAIWLAQFPANREKRVEVVTALINGLGLVAIALWIAWEAVVRLQSPASEILTLPMLITAGVGLGINTLNATLLHDHSHHDLNVRGAFLHMVADAISSLGVIVAAISIWLWHWLWADGAISLIVAGLILGGAVPLIRQSLGLLRQPLVSAPDTLPADSLNRPLASELAPKPERQSFE